MTLCSVRLKDVINEAKLTVNGKLFHAFICRAVKKFKQMLLRIAA